MIGAGKKKSVPKVLCLRKENTQDSGHVLHVDEFLFIAAPRGQTLILLYYRQIPSPSSLALAQLDGSETEEGHEACTEIRTKCRQRSLIYCVHPGISAVSFARTRNKYCKENALPVVSFEITATCQRMCAK